MTTKFCVIGTGRFGHNVAVTLAENGMDVIAIDSNETVISLLRDKVTQAICMKVSDEAALRSIGADEVDVAIVAMGENFAESILVTAILKNRLKVAKVITRSISEMHKEILELIGADMVILPEQEVGTRIADILSLPFSAILRISPDFSIAQFCATEKWAGLTIEEIHTNSLNTVKCIGKKVGEDVTNIGDSYIIRKGDELIFSGKNKDLVKNLVS